MGRLALLTVAIVGLAFPLGLGLAVYLASGSTLAPPAATARIPAGQIARPSLPPLSTTMGETTTDETTTDETETETESGSSGKGTDGNGDDDGKGRGRGRGRGGDD
jgi:hypothetical protein